MISGSYSCDDEDASNVGHDDVTTDKHLWTFQGLCNRSILRLQKPWRCVSRTPPKRRQISASRYGIISLDIRLYFQFVTSTDACQAKW